MLDQFVALLLILWLVFCALTAYMVWERYKAKRKRDRFNYQLSRWRT